MEEKILEVIIIALTTVLIFCGALFALKAISDHYSNLSSDVHSVGELVVSMEEVI